MLGRLWTNRYARVGSLALLSILAICLTIRIVNFVHIFQKHAGVLLTQPEILEKYNAGSLGAGDAVVPQITHQIFHNWTHPSETTLPSDWAAARLSCIDANPDWEHKLWTPEISTEFIQSKYPWFMKTYENFKLPVQKIDALRYFLMRHYGGIYIDLDNGCKQSLEPLRYFPVWVTDGGQGALSNNILGAAPGHPFWAMFTDHIQAYAWNYPLPYITISYATGQWFETVMWEKYHAELPEDGEPLTRVLMDFRPGKPEWTFFNHNRGGTWDNWDNQMFAWIGQHIVLLAVVGIAIPIFTGVVIVHQKKKKKHIYSRIEIDDREDELEELDFHSRQT